ncbi:RebB family R body protein [Xanthomonas medicagonis]|uniref:RebB family R body protein n=1 Tax=Xanthomonas medicagonis TaxID=3160841 RepID=UPI0035127163
MALPTSVDAQITDAVTQFKMKVFSEAPVQAVTSLHESLAHWVSPVVEHAVPTPPSPCYVIEED